MKNLSILLLVLFSSCSNDDTTAPLPFEPVDVAFSLIGKENYSSFDGVSRNLVISNETDWTTLKNILNASSIALGLGNLHTENNFVETTVDFNNYTVIAVIDQGYSNGGHSIDITSIIEYENNIVVTVEKLLTGNITLIVTQPYHIVKIPLTTKPITFE
jgi:hypothetical protein